MSSSQLQENESGLQPFMDVMQWTVVVMMIAVGAVFGIKKYGRRMLPSGINSAITHRATLQIRNHFQAHLLEIGRQRFLVTTDRSGVKTVNPITSWEDFESPVSDSPAA